MAVRKKDAEPAAMDGLEPQDVASFGEDPELLDAAEEAVLASGNAGDAPVKQPRVAAVSDQPANDAGVEGPSQEGTAGESAGRDDEAGENWSEDQVRKMAGNDSVPAWSLVKERQENRALKRNLEELNRKLSEHEEKWNRASERLRLLQERAASQVNDAQRPAQDPEPDPRTDPEAHYQWELRQHRHALEALHQQQQFNNAQVQAAQHQAMLSGLEQQFILGGHPDAPIIANEAAMLVRGAVRQRRNPAMVAHELSE